MKGLRILVLCGVIACMGLAVSCDDGGGSGSGDDLTPPAYDLNGQWNFEKTAYGNCSGEDYPEIESGILTISQSGNTITAIFPDDPVFSGTVSGITISLNQRVSDGDGTLSARVSGFVSNEGNDIEAEGTWSWRANSGGYSCSGTVEFSLNRESGGHSDDVVVFTDTNLESAVRDALGIPSGDIRQSDMAMLDSFDGAFSEIESLEGLEYAVNLTSLQLFGNAISDLSPIENLSALKNLSLIDNNITDITPLQGLFNLSWIDLDNNQITDISPLQGLVNLSRLNLVNNQITDIAPLQGLVNLSGLYLGENQISDINALQGLSKLDYLTLENNQITDIAPLQGLVNLSFLYLTNNQISDINALQGLSKLDYLTLDNNQITDIAPLQGLVNLSFLHLSYNQIIDISAIQGISNLTLLEIEYNQISDLSPLQDLAGLELLYLTNNQITDISPLQGLSELDFLTLKNNQITDISPLVANTGLDDGDTAYLDGNPLNADACNEDIPALEARGVVVGYYGCD